MKKFRGSGNGRGRMSRMILKKEEDLLSKLRNELRQKINKGVELKASQGSDSADLSAFNLDTSLSISFAGQYARSLREINQALKKVKERTYGVCEECGEKIPQGRLKAHPFALFCVPCQSLREEETVRNRIMNEEEDSEPLLVGESELLPF